MVVGDHIEYEGVCGCLKFRTGLDREHHKK